MSPVQWIHSESGADWNGGAGAGAGAAASSGNANPSAYAKRRNLIEGHLLWQAQMEDRQQALLEEQVLLEEDAAAKRWRDHEAQLEEWDELAVGQLDSAEAHAPAPGLPESVVGDTFASSDFISTFGSFRL